ncbi:MAG: FMN-binding glutamate synthase family protein [Planctomycetota bacterium]
MAHHLVTLGAPGWIWWTIPGGIFLFLVWVAIHDIFIQKSSTIKHNFPIVGHLRYMLETIGPELRQYWVANDKEEMPFNRHERSWIYATAKGQNNYFGFGTTEMIYGTGYPIIKNNAFPFPEAKAQSPTDDPTALPCLKVFGAANNRRRPYRPNSIIYISAMSYGSLGRNAHSSLNDGAKEAGCMHNTGEGGVSPYHKRGADIMWQLGTGYFGARGADGKFSLEAMKAECEATPQIRAIEIKMSQGAKPGKGGILPAAKVTPEIAAIRKVEVGKSVISPNAHVEFSDVDGLIDFVEKIADATGLPVGIKSAIGESQFWVDLAKRMKERGCGPDFITVDGAEGGTGAAPLTFSDHVALPFKIGFARVYRIFQEAGMTDKVVFVGSGKLGFPDRAVVALALGCDMIAIAREAMIAIGCIQALQCHTGHCPAGVATMNSWLEAGLNVKNKGERFGRFVKGFRKELIQLAHTAGYEHPGQFMPHNIELSTGINKFSDLAEVMGYTKDVVPFEGMKSLTAV